MSAATTAAPAKAKAPKAAKVAKAPKAAPSHPTYAEMIKKAVVELKEKTGSSKPAIVKYLLANYKLGENVPQIHAHLRTALKRGVTSGALKQTKGTGASGSFKLGEKKTVAPKPKKVVAVKPKAVKKTAGEKKPKSPKKKTAPKPKKAEKKTAAPKKAAVAKKTKPASPKKTKAAAKPKAKKVAAPKKA